MPAYIIAQVKINDPKRYEDYRRMVPASLAAHGGKFIVRGGRVEPLEGDWQPPRLVVLEFPSAAAARGWWESDDYAEAKALRQAIAETQMLIVEGI